MCGIAGCWNPSAPWDAEHLQDIAVRMASTIVHRGPDDSGTWIDSPAGIALCFRRLAIVDLTSAGHQPMISASGRYVMVFNGEVYNFESLRRELTEQGLAPVFRGHSDTEVMLAAIEAWGLEQSVPRFMGMFAFALWDRQERVLHLVRDRVGVKPLYYGWAGKTLMFGSELRTLRAHPDFQGEVDRGSLALMMRQNNVPAPYSIYKNIYKLMPGTFLTIREGDTQRSQPKAYWSAKSVVENGVAHPFTGSDGEAIERLEALLKDAIGLRMIADVPLGAFLSGGIDSALVVALMQAQSSRPVKTFTIGFSDPAYDEAGDASKVAQYLNTNHTELYVTPEDTLNLIPDLPRIFDEPFADNSQIPNYLVSCLARKHVTVSLSGDGGDELFAGYRWYTLSQRIWDRIGWMPPAMRKSAAHALKFSARLPWGDAPFLGAPLQRGKARNAGDTLVKLARIADAGTPDEVYHRLVSTWQESDALVLGASEPLMAHTDPQRQPDIADPILRMMYFDLINYLPEDIMTKVDRSSMSASLEAREPLLDHRLIEFAWQLPFRFKVRDGQTKWLLRQVLYRHVPKELIERPKRGFEVPIAAWLRGPLRDWAESLLSEERLRREGYLNPAVVRTVWKEHLSGQRDWKNKLWNILMFQAWLEAYPS